MLTAHGFAYRIVVSDLVRRRPLWFGGTDRSEASLAAFYQWLGPTQNQRIRLAVMRSRLPRGWRAKADPPQKPVIQFRSPYAFRQLEMNAFQRARVWPF